MQVGELYASLELRNHGFDHALRKSSDAVYGFAKLAVGLSIAAGTGLTIAFGKAASSAETYYLASKKISGITGLNIADSSKLVAIFQRFGLEGDKATKAMGMLMKNVGNLTLNEKLAAKFTQEFGFALRGANGQVFDANQLISEAADYFVNKNIPATQKAALESKLFGRNWQDMVPILSLGSKGIQNATDAAAKLGLVLNESNVKDLAAYRDNQIKLSEALAGLKLQMGLAVMPVLIAFGNLMADRVIPAIRALLQRVRDWIDAHSALIASFKTVIGTVLGLGNTLRGSLLGSIGSAITKVADWVKANKPLIDQLRAFSSGVMVAGVKALTEGFQKLGTTGPLVAGLVGAMLLLNGALRANPIIGSITLIIAAVGLLATAWQSNFAGIQDVGYTVLHKIQGVMADLATPLQTMANNVLPAFGAVWNWLATNILPPIESIFNTISTVVVPALQSALAGIGGWISSNWPGITTLVGHIGDVVKTAFDVAAAAIGIAMPILVKIGEVVFPAIGLAASLLLGAINGAFYVIGVVWKGAGDAVNTLKTAISDAFSFISTVVTTVGGVIGGIIGGIIDAIKTAVSWIDTLIGKGNAAGQTPAGRAAGFGGGTSTGGAGGGGSFGPMTPITPSGVGSTIPKHFIPSFASGIPNFSGGWARVGESGPELLRLPGGTRVFSAAQTAAMLGGGGMNFGDIHISVSGVGSDVSPAAAHNFGRNLIDEFTSQLRDQSGQVVRVRPAIPQ